MFALIVVALVAFAAGVFVGDKYAVQIAADVTKVETTAKSDVSTVESDLKKL